MAALTLTLILGIEGQHSNKPLPYPPRQFSAQIETTAHQLNATLTYPPHKRYMTVHYDYSNRRARVDFHPMPHMPPKVFVRRYDSGFEWTVMEVYHTKECQKSLLYEAMPMPYFPDHFIYLGQTHVRGKLCDHWREDNDEESIEYFATAEDGASPVGTPLRLTTEAVETNTPQRKTRPLMTYDFSYFKAREPSEELFKMHSSTASSIFANDSPLRLTDCERAVQEMGFPYIHLFHRYYYV